jgi:hypothetical protein
MTPDETSPTNTTDTPSLQGEQFQVVAHDGDSSSNPPTTNIGIFQQDELSSMPSLLARTDQLDFDSDDDSEFNDDETVSTDSTDSIPGLVPRTDAYDAEDDEDSRPNFELTTHEPGATDVSTCDSSASNLSQPLTLQDVTPFEISSIQIPTISGSDTMEGEATEVGSQHQQVLESWRAIFGKPKTPSPTASGDTDPDKDVPAQPRRYRQQRLPSTNSATNEPHGDVMRAKQEGYHRVYFINLRRDPQQSSGQRN